MQSRILWLGLVASTAVTVVWGASCGKRTPLITVVDDGGSPDVENPRPDGGPDGGLPDGGGPDGGVQCSSFNFPNLSNWQFFGRQNGGPCAVFGVTSDASGNIWVAGGEEGLFLLKPGAVTFRKYTMTDGLHPYGYLADGGVPVGDKYLKVISVAGGPANTVFVGYQGKPPAPGQRNCEANAYYDEPGKDPNIYKSGDADRVTLQPDGRISVVHYDIFTGPGQLSGGEDLPDIGREKLCDILRITYDPVPDPTNHKRSVWFGANHGFAWGDADYAGDPTCNGQPQCSGVWEHTHPAINAWSDEQHSAINFLTGDYYGLAVNSNHDVWFGGVARTTLFRYGTLLGDWWEAGRQVECADCISNRIDVWPDRVGEPNIPTPSERVDDFVSDIAAMPDGSVWIGSFTQGLGLGGLAHYQPGPPPRVTYRRDTQVDPHGNVTGLERDSANNSLWIGYSYGGLARLNGSAYTAYDYRVFGLDLTQAKIPDIQSDNFGGRRILVAFHGDPNQRIPGAIGIYTGE